MGEIIAFPSNTGRNETREPPSDGGAQILFFLGVRYMRLEDEQTKGAPHENGGEAGRGKKRKRRA